MAYEILIPLEEENKYLALETRYQLGGQNCGTGNNEKWGIYLNFTKQTKIKRDGYVSTQTSLYAQGNYKIFIKELSRKQDKQLLAFHNYVKSIQEELFVAWKNNNTEEIFRLINIFKEKQWKNYL